ncbi:helix-turn-helix domain-containing protein [Paenibacillus campinasensis]|uniref:helix-turn-helix domain-containing protein n=1 Tax=Paenibacillus campinasensis TaxID=66347 RepID=UPI00117E876E|nr:helix-turn-helix domain-containing protein [Paenibacillus campinasensis]
MNPLDHIMGTEDAAKLWSLSQDHIKRLCRDGKVKCIRIGKTWILDKNQPKPGTS